MISFIYIPPHLLDIPQVKVPRTTSLPLVRLIKNLNSTYHAVVEFSYHRFSIRPLTRTSLLIRHNGSIARHRPNAPVRELKSFFIFSERDNSLLFIVTLLCLDRWKMQGSTSGANASSFCPSSLSKRDKPKPPLEPILQGWKISPCGLRIFRGRSNRLVEDCNNAP